MGSSSKNKKKKTSHQKVPVVPVAGRRVLPLSEVRSRLSPLVRTIAKNKRALGIAVRGKVQAYLVAAEQYEGHQSQARGEAIPLEGSLKRFFSMPDDIEKAIKQNREEMLAESLREWDELNGE